MSTELDTPQANRLSADSDDSGSRPGLGIEDGRGNSSRDYVAWSTNLPSPI